MTSVEIKLKTKIKNGQYVEFTNNEENYKFCVPLEEMEAFVLLFKNNPFIINLLILEAYTKKENNKQKIAWEFAINNIKNRNPIFYNEQLFRNMNYIVKEYNLDNKTLEYVENGERKTQKLGTAGSKIAAKIREGFEDLGNIAYLIGSQTKNFVSSVNFFVEWRKNHDSIPNIKSYDLNENGNKVLLDKSTLLSFCSDTVNHIHSQLIIVLPKPFLLLAGISGTGKTRFVREQAIMAAKKYDLEEGVNFCLVPVRPDWHEPSDLLGYISRISGVRYVATDFLKFMILAWCHAAESADEDNIVLKNVDEIPPFWLCLDEMNLAPVEQYFADYLSVLETREWRGETKAYHCEALLKVGVFDELEGCTVLGEAENAFEVFWKSVCPPTEQNKELRDNLKQYFRKNGIPLPPNLIVAGTVNMDETTHGFSRKVIDRALTLDFQEFFPNNYDEFFSVENNGGMKMFSFPRITQVRPEDLKNSIDLKQTEIAQESVVENDSALPEPNGDEASGVKPESDQNESEASSASVESRSVEFLKGLNGILKDTPFELGFRALNELLLSVVCMRPSDNQALLAVWDDFLMQKVLPRIEGDTQKLKSLHGTKVEGHDEGTYGSGSILHDLYSFLRSDEALREIWDKGRPDLLRGGQGDINCRTRKKLEWMMRRLRTRRSTDFWV